jgi:hypothetical protein
MSNEIEKAYINAFKGGVEQAFQQTVSKFRGVVETGSQASEFDYEDRIGLADDMNEVNTRYGVNPMNDVPHDRRRTSLRDWDWGKPIDEKDLVRVATDPTNAYMQAGMSAANRKMDDVIIAGLTAPAYTGKEGENTVNFVGTTADKVTIGAVSNQAGHIVADSRYAVTAGLNEGIDVNVSFGAASSGTAQGLTLKKLKVVKETFMGTLALDQRDVPMINAFISRRQWDDLLNINEIVNNDFAMKGRLERLEVVEWGGFRFQISERLTKTGNNRNCLFFMPKAGKLKFSQDITANMWRLPDRKNIPYIYIKMGFGMTRMWGECLARVSCVEA